MNLRSRINRLVQAVAEHAADDADAADIGTLRRFPYEKLPADVAERFLAWLEQREANPVRRGRFSIDELPIGLRESVRKALGAMP